MPKKKESRLAFADSFTCIEVGNCGNVAQSRDVCELEIFAGGEVADELVENSIFYPPSSTTHPSPHYLAKERITEETLNYFSWTRNKEHAYYTSELRIIDTPKIKKSYMTRIV